MQEQDLLRPGNFREGQKARQAEGRTKKVERNVPDAMLPPRCQGRMGAASG